MGPWLYQYGKVCHWKWSLGQIESQKGFWYLKYKVIEIQVEANGVQTSPKMVLNVVEAKSLVLLE